MGVVGVSDQLLGLPQFLIPKDQLLVGGNVVVSGKEALHLGGARRLRKGHRVRLADGRGRVAVAEITRVGKTEVILSILEVLAVRSDVIPLTILLSVIRFERFDLAISKLSEIGVADIQPVVTERSRLSGSDIKRLDVRVQRWQGLCFESLKQSKGFVATMIRRPRCLKEAIGTVTDASCKVALLAEKGGGGLFHTLKKGKAVFPAALVIGPEGGFSGKEKDLLKEAGFISAGLGSRILRSETAAIYGAAVFSELFACKGEDS